jgi:hypothetical protein
VTVLGFDLHEDLIGAGQAADLANVSVFVIRNWASRGYRDPLSGEWQRIRTVRGLDRRAYYYGIDVLRAEAATRPRARRILASLT